MWAVVVAVVVGSVVAVANVVVVAIQAAVSKHGSAQTHFMLSPKNTYNYNGILPKSLHTHTHTHTSTTHTHTHFTHTHARTTHT